MLTSAILLPNMEVQLKKHSKIVTRVMGQVKLVLITRIALLILLVKHHKHRVLLPYMEGAWSNDS